MDFLWRTILPLNLVSLKVLSWITLNFEFLRFWSKKTKSCFLPKTSSINREFRLEFVFSTFWKFFFVSWWRLCSIKIKLLHIDIKIFKIYGCILVKFCKTPSRSQLRPVFNTGQSWSRYVDLKMELNIHNNYLFIISFTIICYSYIIVFLMISIYFSESPLAWLDDTRT